MTSIGLPSIKEASIVPDLLNMQSKLMEDMKNKPNRLKAFYKSTGNVEYDQFFPRNSKNLIDKIDQIIALNYSFTEEELDFIVNYDIKYRMGKELMEAGVEG